MPAQKDLPDKTLHPVSQRASRFCCSNTGGKTEVSDLLDLYHVHPDIRFTTWEDFDIMAMVEKGMGISILPI